MADNVPTTIDAGLPAYLTQGGPPIGLDNAREYGTVARIDVVSANNGELCNALGIGSMYLSPDNTGLCKFGETLTVVPLFSWTTWQRRRDRDDPEHNNSTWLIAETMDPDSDIAIKAKNLEDDTYGNGFTAVNCEALNFVVRMLDGPMAGIDARVSYAMTRHKIGRRLCGYIARRGVHIFCNKIHIFPTKMSGKGNTWHAIEWDLPEFPFISEDMIPALRETHLGLVEAHAQGQMVAAQGNDDS